MWLLPYDSFTIDTALSREEAARRLADRIYPKQERFYWTQPRGRGFEGVVTTDGFEVNRIITYRNSGTPIAYGRYTGGVDGSTRIRVRLTLHPVVLAFCVALLLVCGYSLVKAARLYILTAVVGADLITAAVFVGFMYLVLMFGWFLEVGKLRKFLQSTFQT